MGLANSPDRQGFGHLCVLSGAILLYFLYPTTGLLDGALVLGVGGCLGGLVATLIRAVLPTPSSSPARKFKTIRPRAVAGSPWAGLPRFALVFVGLAVLLGLLAVGLKFRGWWPATKRTADSEQTRQVQFAAQQRAVKLYPDLAVPNSQLNQEFLRRYQQYRKENPAYFNDLEWPTQLARESQAALRKL